MRTHIGPYRIEAPLGRGGMGVVYRGVHEHLGRPVAIKALAAELTQQPEFKERFFSEAKTQARLQHPNIVGVYDLLEDGGEYFIVMEFVAGEGLDDLMKPSAERPMDLLEAVGIFSQVLAALDYAHSEGVIHRDIKPSNVMVTAGGRVKLTDFGIALLIGDKRLTASQSSIGTPTYMSPEQIVRPRSVDHRTDLYSAAVVFYEMLAGRPPFDDDTEYGIKKLHVEAPLPDIAELRPGLPAGVLQVLATALSKNPDDRFASAGLFLRALQEAVPQALPQGATPLPAPAYRSTTLDSAWTGTGAAAPVRPPVPPPPAGAGRKNIFSALLAGKNRWIAAAAAAALVLVLGFGAVVLILSAGAGEEKAADAAVSTEAPLQTVPEGAGPVPVQIQAQAVPVPVVAEGPAPSLAGAPEAEPQQRQPLRLPAAQPATAPPPPMPTRKDTAEGTPPPLPAPTSPPPQVEAPRPPEPAPEPRPEPDSPATLAIDHFKETESLIVNIARLSEQAFEAYEEEGREDDLYSGLEGFSEAAAETRKEFRRTTGTGVRGTFSKLKRRGGQGDAKALEMKVDDLTRRAGEIDRQISSSSLSIQGFWREVSSNLRKLESYF